MRYTEGVDDGPARRRLRGHLSVRGALPQGGEDESPLPGRGALRLPPAAVPPWQPDLELPLAAPGRRAEREGPPLRRLRPHGVWPVREASAPVRLHARAACRERAGRDRRAGPAGRHARCPRLGRADRPGRDARARRAVARRGPDEHLGLGAAELAAALHPRVPYGGARRDPCARRQPVRGVGDPGRDGTPRPGPHDDGGLPGAVPGLLVACRDARLPARHPAHRARQQRAR